MSSVFCKLTNYGRHGIFIDEQMRMQLFKLNEIRATKLVKFPFDVSFGNYVYNWIKEIGRKNRELRHALEYVDFPHEKIRWTKLYQCSKSKDKKRTLMVRPCFPSVYREHQMPNVHIISDTVVIANDVWKVGDLVDWWTDNCFWTRRITEKFDDENVKVELLPPPRGEGSLYDASCKDLRPSLEWSVDEGWKLPKGDKYGHFCARIVKPLNQVSSLHIQDTSKQMLGMTDKFDDNGLKKKKIDGSLCLNSTYSDTIEAAVLDLEELICRVKWLQRILDFGTPLPDTSKSSWKFIEHRSSSIPK
ncbi:uncharacterized protein LOC120199986 [Hibiscus syriacus]|nr:uncharacterized protein LOC120199986 [Hibiscus syriacus]